MMMLVEQKDLKKLIRRFLEYLEIERNCSQLTIRNYKHYLDELCVFLLAEKKVEKLGIGDINMEAVRKFRLYLSRKKGRNGMMKIVTQGYYIIALRSFLKWLIKNDHKVLQPEKLDVPKRKSESLKFLDVKQMERLLNQPILSTKTGLRDRAILELLFSTGLRVSELVALNRSNINLKNREFGVVGKGGRARVVFVSQRATNLIDRYLRTRIDKFKPLFVRYAGKHEFGASEESYRLTSRSIQRLVKKYVRSAKLPVDATPHTLRHSMATDLLRSGADIRSVQEILGHKNIATTQIYTHVTDRRLREVHEKFHSGNKKK
ncbi:tyrosine-type recombinase/integrase [Patescibacteria group bacterium]|nr:tyrosine-type recombinase/integrase [Patescibacteria group bacterium]